MFIRLSDRLGIDDQLKTEITNHLAFFLKQIQQTVDIDNVTPEDLTSWWLNNIHKPTWVEEKINTEIEFVAGVHDFFERYRQAVDQFEAVAEFKPKAKKSPFKLLLEGLEIAKNKQPLDTAGLSKEEILHHIDKLFYINNENDSLVEIPF
jgi:hypothetical protein